MTADNASNGPDGRVGPDDAPVTATAISSVAGRSIEVEYAVDSGRLLAGGPLDLTVTVALRDGAPARLIASSARSTGRSREYSFHGTLGTPVGGATLRDPYADAIEIGGVADRPAPAG